MKSIPNALFCDKSSHAQTLPENGAQTNVSGISPTDKLKLAWLRARRDQMEPEALRFADEQSLSLESNFLNGDFSFSTEETEAMDSLNVYFVVCLEITRLERVVEMTGEKVEMEHGAEVAAQVVVPMTAYAALQTAFRQWLDTENVRAHAEAERIQRELDDLYPTIRYDAERLNLAEDFDFDSCAIGEEEAPRFKRFLALNVALEREAHRAWIVGNALKNRDDVGAAYAVFTSCHDEDLLGLHTAMIEEMFATA